MPGLLLSGIRKIRTNISLTKLRSCRPAFPAASRPEALTAASAPSG